MLTTVFDWDVSWQQKTFYRVIYIILSYVTGDKIKKTFMAITNASEFFKNTTWEKYLGSYSLTKKVMLAQHLTFCFYKICFFLNSTF